MGILGEGVLVHFNVLWVKRLKGSQHVNHSAPVHALFFFSVVCTEQTCNIK
jgi:hypothetical protein